VSAHLQQRPPGYELFFAPLEVEFDPTTLERVQFAYIASKVGHDRQKRDNGTRFFDHPKTAAWIYMSELEGRDPETIIDILLHDLQEDSYLLSSYRIALNFGRERALDIRALTKLPKGKESTSLYLGRIITRGPRPILSKLCDRLHNLRDMAHCTEEKRRHQIQETQQYHLPLLIPALRQYDEPWKSYADDMKHKMLEAIASY
jgi:GTP pyrophosphokinase